MAMIYFAHPIDHSNSVHNAVADRIRHALTEQTDVAIFEPSRAWIVTKPYSPAIQAVNEQALHAADTVIAYMPSDVHTRGVPLEIGIALGRGIPIVLIVDHEFGKHSAVEANLMDRTDVDAFSVDFCKVAAWRAASLARLQDTDQRAVAKYTGDTNQLQQAHDGDAGYDLAYNGTEPMQIAAGARVAIPTGVSVEMPAGYFSLIVGRSSSFSRRDLLVPLSVIDAGFRGELFAVCWNYGTQTQEIQPRERIAQVLPMRLEAANIRWINAPLTDSARGTDGFGSSGR